MSEVWLALTTTLLVEVDFTFQPSPRREQIDSLHELDFIRRLEKVGVPESTGSVEDSLAISLTSRAAHNDRADALRVSARLG